MWIAITQPSLAQGEKSDVDVDPDRLKEHVRVISETYYPRDFTSTGNLNACADYIRGHFTRAGARSDDHRFTIGRREYRNVIGSFGPSDGPRIVVGAHYDACGDTPGADDNASGVAGLVELGYLLGRTNLQMTVELVAFALEEPPFFRSGDMGSARYARRLRSEDIDVRAMIALEMIGYFSDDDGSQQFPMRLLRLFYPDRGNFIGVVGCMNQGRLIRTVKSRMAAATDLPVYSLRAPRFVPGVDFSDHINFWNEGYPVVMITDTAFYRNLEYHGAGDTFDRLDYDRMAKVVSGVFEAVLHLADGTGRGSGNVAVHKSVE